MYRKKILFFRIFQYFCPFFQLTAGKTALKFNSALIFHSFPVVKKKWKKIEKMIEKKIEKKFNLSFNLFFNLFFFTTGNEWKISMELNFSAAIPAVLWKNGQMKIPSSNIFFSIFSNIFFHCISAELNCCLYTECWGESNSKKKLPQKFLQNTFLGCLWSPWRGKMI